MNMLLLVLELLVTGVTFLYSFIYCMCYKKQFYTAGLGDIASFDPATQVNTLLRVYAIL